jgi:DNA repair exonuclease SbcCD ATPase subunit
MKLIQQDNKDKRELFETIFETEWVSQCKTRCDEDLKTWDSDLLKLGWNINKSSTEIEHLTDKLSTVKLVISNFEGHRTAKRVNKEVEQKQYTTKLAELETELVTYQDQFTNIKYDAAAHDALNEQFEALDKQFNESRLTEVTYSGKLTSAQNLIESKKAEYLRVSTEHLKLVDKHIKGNCPYCEQELKTGNKLEVNHNKDIASAFEKVGIVSMAVKEAEKALKALQKLKAPVTPESITKEKEAIEEQLIAMDELFTTHQDTAESIKNINNELIQAKKDLLRANNELIVIAAEKPPVVDIKNIELNILQEQDKLKGLEDEKPKIEKKIEIAKWWSSKGFSSGGIKAYIFTAMLTQLNQNVKKYGDRLGASLEFSIDLTKASKPFTTVCSLGDKLNKDYKDFSGGEKQKLDIALIFAMHDLISMNTDMNILIMDECFEGLSEDGETAVFDLIRSKAEEGKSIYIITHSAVLDSLYANTIQFENKQGNTLILN